MEMDQNDRIIYPELPKIRIKKSGISEVICVQIHTKSSGPRHFIRNGGRSGLTEVYCISDTSYGYRSKYH